MAASKTEGVPQTCFLSFISSELLVRLFHHGTWNPSIPSQDGKASLTCRLTEWKCIGPDPLDKKLIERKMRGTHRRKALARVKVNFVWPMRCYLLTVVFSSAASWQGAVLFLWGKHKKASAKKTPFQDRSGITHSMKISDWDSAAFIIKSMAITVPSRFISKNWSFY